MTHALDSSNTYIKYDPKNALGSIDMIPEQYKQAWSEVKKIKFPKGYRECDHIVFCGMGGSSLGAHVIKSLFSDQIKVPFTIVRNYKLPASVNKRTLVVCTTYSGTTEEALSMFKDAKKRGARLVAVTTGKSLSNMAKRAKVPAYIFDDSLTNPSDQPRIGVGITLMAGIAILKQLRYIKLSDKDARSAMVHASRSADAWKSTVPMRKNTAKQLADQLVGRMPMYIGSEHLMGNMHILSNQTNETAKTFASYFEIPEINHHLLEGLSSPKEKRALHFVMFPSKLYHTRIQKRHSITAGVIEKNDVDLTEIHLTGRTQLEQAFDVLQFGSYVTLYMAMLQRIDPAKIPWVDYFKKRLK